MDARERADTYPMIVIAMTAVGWLALMVLFVAACYAARQGDDSKLKGAAARTEDVGNGHSFGKSAFLVNDALDMSDGRAMISLHTSSHLSQ
jgi:hypothetical protein